jgi:hypothetical protein
LPALWPGPGTPRRTQTAPESPCPAGPRTVPSDQAEPTRPLGVGQQAVGGAPTAAVRPVRRSYPRSGRPINLKHTHSLMYFCQAGSACLIRPSPSPAVTPRLLLGIPTTCSVWFRALSYSVHLTIAQARPRPFSISACPRQYSFGQRSTPWRGGEGRWRCGPLECRLPSRDSEVPQLPHLLPAGGCHRQVPFGDPTAASLSDPKPPALPLSPVPPG